MGSDHEGVTYGTDAGPGCLPWECGLPCCTPEQAGHTNCRGTWASKAASSVSPGASTLNRCICWTAAGVLAWGPLAMQPWGPCGNGFPTPSVHGQTWDKSGPFVDVSCLLSFFSATSNTYPMSALC